MVIEDRMILEVGSFSLDTNQQTLIDQDVNRQSDCITSYPVLAFQFAFDRQRLAALPLSGHDPTAQICGQPLVFGSLSGATGNVHSANVAIRLAPHPRNQPT
nr:hypothetical protein [Streptacidiphilus albus]